VRTDNHNIRVFLASPGDVEEERLAFRELLTDLSTRTDYEFIPLGWEDVLASTGHRPQDLINSLLDQCDIFVSVYHKRWGQASTDAVGYTAYTQEEFQRALRRHMRTGVPRIFCFFKQVEISALADPGEQLSKVLKFRRSLETSAQVMYRVFSCVDDFRSQIEEHLLAMVRGELPAPETTVRRIHVPIVSDQEPEHDISRELALAKQAALAAANGYTDEAAVLFARLSQTSRNIQILDAARAFFSEDGNVDAAQSLLERKITLIHDRRLAAREYVSVFMAAGWLDDLVNGTPNKEEAETLRRIFTGDRFQEVLVQSMAEYFSVGELLALARFYSGEGGTITRKFGSYMATIPALIEQILDDDSQP